MGFVVVTLQDQQLQLRVARSPPRASWAQFNTLSPQLAKLKIK